jgi:hypothetical protein
VNKSRRKLLKCETAATFTPPQKEEVTVWKPSFKERHNSIIHTTGWFWSRLRYIL